MEIRAIASVQSNGRLYSIFLQNLLYKGRKKQIKNKKKKKKKKGETFFEDVKNLNLNIVYLLFFVFIFKR
jgi:hypothetical protein